jgi:hypothetical protein
VVPADVRHFVQSHFTLTLATAAENIPWAAAVFYVSDDELNLYFVSDPATRHVREAMQSGLVAVAIHGAHQNWTAISGVQLAARLEEVPEAEREQVEILYFRRFTDVGSAVRAPGNAMEGRVAERFAKSRFYRITPLRLRFIDNARGFGKAQEIEFRVP